MINGEELTDIQCKLDSDGGIKNHLLGSFKQAPKGVLSAELDYNHEQKLLQGNIVAIYGNVRSILKMAKADYNVDGLARAKLQLIRMVRDQVFLLMSGWMIFLLMILNMKK